MELYYFITENDSRFFSFEGFLFKIGEDIRINWEILLKVLSTLWDAVLGGWGSSPGDSDNPTIKDHTCSPA